jgi:fucose 4-O-acetylase-like acetyltransferase
MASDAGFPVDSETESQLQSKLQCRLQSCIHSQSNDAPAPVVVAGRDHYIDRLRSAMTVLVIVCHSAMTYGGRGNWFYRELEPSGRPTSLLFTFMVGTTQAFAMGFFFLLSGYFTPRPLERKGYVQFLQDRFLRLGVPLLAFIFFLGPLTAAMVDWAQGRGFWATIAWLWRHHRAINGPLWFAEALLLLSLGYCGWRAVFGSPLEETKRAPKAVPAQVWWIAAAIGTGLGSIAIRRVCPVGRTILGLQVGYFSGYIVLFAVGIAAWRYDWLRQLEWRHARPWVVSLIFEWPTLPLMLVVSTAFSDTGGPNFNGGLGLPAMFYAFWEPFVAWGLICICLLVFRAWVNRPSAIWDWIDRRAYAVYIVHSPVLVGISLALRSWGTPALVKFTVSSVLACVACWLIADPILRIPGMRRIV